MVLRHMASGQPVTPAFMNLILRPKYSVLPITQAVLDMFQGLTHYTSP